MAVQGLLMKWIVLEKRKNSLRRKKLKLTPSPDWISS
jgi:hypothetical protein